uniref:hypothetical protein n=1 Tax=Okeania sp. SIO2F4 TaxID=2607790 RepID=UPI0025D5A3B9|nr:hypothetical protein [Okeania sp. SIO2F4]
MQVSEKITKISSIAEIRECQTTGNKSLHTTIEFKSGEVISSFGYQEILDRPNYLTVQIGVRSALR